MRPTIHTRRLLLTAPARCNKSTNTKKKKRFGPAKCFTQAAASRIPESFNPEKPTRFKRLFQDLPAYEKWFLAPGADWEDPERQMPSAFTHVKRKKKDVELQRRALLAIHGVRRLNMEYLGKFGDITVPLELTTTDMAGGRTFERFDGPLSMLLEHMGEKKLSRTQLYLAQYSLADLPQPLRDDLPTPELLKILGKGDLYGSSLWMGKRPTKTPLHRDPNPNLLVQIAGKKTVRMMAPEVGREMYEQARAELGASAGLANMRGEEMMQGKEFEALEKAVWGTKKDKDQKVDQTIGFEVELSKGDGVYIPMGWWHAVRGEGQGPNVSANWWFR